MLFPFVENPVRVTLCGVWLHVFLVLAFWSGPGTGTFGRVRLVRKGSEFYALKIMTIGEVMRLKQTVHVKSEKNILLKIKHPFIVDL